MKNKMHFIKRCSIVNLIINIHLLNFYVTQQYFITQYKFMSATVRTTIKQHFSQTSGKCIFSFTVNYNQKLKQHVSIVV